jgi:hypothetical protein
MDFVHCLVFYKNNRKMVNKTLYFRDRTSFCLQAKIIRFTQLGPVGPEFESNFANT